MTLEELYQIIENRKNELPEKSYTASLFRGEKDRIIQKVGEEATEVIIAAKNKSRTRIISEIADLWFHLLIYMSRVNIKPDDIYRELDIRRKKRLVPASKTCYDQMRSLRVKRRFPKGDKYD